MKQDDKLYNEWLDEVRNVQPILSNPDELTTAILQQVSRNSIRQKEKKKPRISCIIAGKEGLEIFDTRRVHTILRPR